MQEIDALGRRAYTAFLTYANKAEPEAQIRLLRAFNVGQVVTFQPLSISGLTLSREVPENYSWLYKIDQPVPRSYIVNRSAVERDAMRTLQRLASEEFNPAAEVLLDREFRISPQSRFLAKSKILDYRNTLVTIETETNGDGVLVLLDSYYPGWKAYVDGKETQIARANHFYRAVPLPQGRHVVEFKYEPLSFKLGLLISLSTIIAVIGISLLLHFRSRRSLRSPA
jgi:Bacterial membrane protein YfhO